MNKVSLPRVSTVAYKAFEAVSKSDDPDLPVDEIISQPDGVDFKPQVLELVETLRAEDNTGLFAGGDGAPESLTWRYAPNS